MDVEYTGRQFRIIKKYKTQTEAGLERIAKVVGEAASVHVILTADKYRQIAEVTLKTRTAQLVAKCESTEMETALHDALNKVEKQAIRQKQKKTTEKRHSKADIKSVASREAEGLPETVELEPAQKATKTTVGRKVVPMVVHSFPSRSPIPEPHVVRSPDSVALRPMSLEEAVKEAEFRDRDVFVFRDAKGQAMVLHRKRDGQMELIEVP